MNFKQGTINLKTIFLRETDLDLLKSRNLEPSDLITLPMNKDVTDDDCLEWLEYQRGMENLYAGFKVTTYNQSSDNPNGDFNRKGAVYQAKYLKVLDSDRKPKVGKFAYYYVFNGTMYLIHSNNTVSNNAFIEIQGDLSLAMFRGYLGALGNHDFYQKEERKVSDTVQERGYIDAGFVLSKVVA